MSGFLPFPRYRDERTVHRRQGAGLEGVDHSKVCTLWCDGCAGSRAELGTVYATSQGWVVEKRCAVDWRLGNEIERSGVPTQFWMVGTVESHEDVHLLCAVCGWHESVKWSHVERHLRSTPAPRKLKVRADGVVTR